MKESTKDTVEGTVHEVKGAIKSHVGKLTNDTELEAEGSWRRFPAQSRRKSRRWKKSSKNRKAGAAWFCVTLRRVTVLFGLA